MEGETAIRRSGTIRHKPTRAWAALVLTTALVAAPLAGGRGDQRMLGKRLPPLHVGSVIQGRAADVGAWGDGKVYVVDLWGTWCPPCIANIPALTTLQTTYRDRGLVVIGYSWEPADVLKPFVEKMGKRMGYTVVSDPEERTLQQLVALEAVQSFPYAFLVDRRGLVIWEGHPEDDDLAGAVARFFAKE